MTKNRTGLDPRHSFSFLLVLTGVGLALSFLIARPFLAPIVTATLLAAAIQPVFTQLLRYMPNRGLAALVTTAMVFIALLLPAVFFVQTLANETAALYGWFELRTESGEGWSDYISRLMERPLGWAAEKAGISQQDLRNTALEQLRNLSVKMLDWAKSLAINVTGTIGDAFIMFFTLFFLLRDGRYILDRVGRMIPLEPKRYEALLQTISDSIIANIYGVIAVSISQAILGALGYWIAGLPNVFLWSVMTALLSMIPFLGAIGVWGVGVIYLLTIGHWGHAVFLVAYGTLVISMADNIVRPLVLSGRVKMNTLLIFFSLLGGVRAFGIVGLFVGPIIVSLTIALINMLTTERARWDAAEVE